MADSNIKSRSVGPRPLITVDAHILERRMGRHAKPPGERRDEVLTVMVARHLKMEVLRAAEAADLSTSSYLEQWLIRLMAADHAKAGLSDAGA